MVVVIDGLPLGFVLTGGQTHDCTQVITLLGDRRSEAVLADKGYDTDLILNHLNEHSIVAVIRRVCCIKSSAASIELSIANATASNEPSPTSNNSRDSPHASTSSN